MTYNETLIADEAKRLARLRLAHWVVANRDRILSENPNIGVLMDEEGRELFYRSDKVCKFGSVVATENPIKLLEGDTLAEEQRRAAYYGFGII